MADAQAEIRKTAKKLLGEKKVDVVVGYAAGSNPLRTTPYFARREKEIDNLVWNDYCTYNLANYLPRHADERVAVVAKGCDSRSVIEVVKNEQAKREKVYVIGVVCPGVLSAEKALAKIGAKAYDTPPAFDEKLLEDRCTQCICHTPPLADTLIGEPFDEPTPPLPKKVEEFLAKTPKERLSFWKKAFSRCIKCNACKEICPNCFCDSCVLTDRPEWLDKERADEQLWLYQLIRVYHNAGRCTECGQCVRACPMNIPLGLLIKPMLEDLKELFGYEAGLSLDEKDPLVTYNLESDEGMLE